MVQIRGVMSLETLPGFKCSCSGRWSWTWELRHSPPSVNASIDVQLFTPGTVTMLQVPLPWDSFYLNSWFWSKAVIGADTPGSLFPWEGNFQPHLGLPRWMMHGCWGRIVLGRFCPGFVDRVREFLPLWLWGLEGRHCPYIFLLQYVRGVVRGWNWILAMFVATGG